MTPQDLLAWRTFNAMDFRDHVLGRFTYEDQWLIDAHAGWYANRRTK